VYVLHLPDNWLELGIIYTIQRFDYYQVIIVGLLLQYSSLYRGEMLLVGQVYVVQQGALSW
jgi:hypothetical protein